MENVFLAESGSASIIDAKKTAKKKYKCPYCEARIERSKLHIHIQDEHEDLIPEGYTALRVAFNAINHKTEGHCIICKGVTDWNEDKARYERLLAMKLTRRLLPNVLRESMALNVFRLILNMLTMYSVKRLKVVRCQASTPLLTVES